MKQVDGIFVRDSCNVCNSPYETVTARSGEFWCLDMNKEVQSCPAGQYFQITTDRSATNSSSTTDSDAVDGSCTPCESGTYATGPGKRLECTSCGLLPGTTKQQTSIVGSTSVDDCFVEKLYADKGNVYCTGFGEDDRRSGLTALSVQECEEFAEEFKDEGLVYSDEPPCQDDTELCPDYLEQIGCNNQFESIDSVTGLKTDIVVNDICPVSCNVCRALSNGTPYTDSTPTGCVVVITETGDQIVRYYSPSEEPSLPDAPIIAAMYTGEPFQPACKAHICELNTTTSDAVLYISQGDAVRDDSTFQYSIPTCGPNLRQIGMWLASESKTNTQIFIPTAAGVTAVSMIGAYYFTGDDTEHRFQFVVFGVGLRMFDLVTDWGNYVVNIRGDLFAFAYGDQDVETEDANVKAMIQFTLAICILSSMLTPFDIWGASQRTTYGDRFLWLIVAVLLFEDVPQLGITGNYIYYVYNAVISDEYYTAAEYITSDIIAIISLAASVANILYNIFLLMCRKKRALGGSANYTTSSHSNQRAMPQHQSNASSQLSAAVTHVAPVHARTRPQNVPVLDLKLKQKSGVLVSPLHSASTPRSFGVEETSLNGPNYFFVSDCVTLISAHFCCTFPQAVFQYLFALEQQLSPL